MLKFRWETEFKETEIGQIPKEWEVKRLKEILDIKHGFAFSSKTFRESGEIPVIKIQNIQEDNSVNFNDIQFVNPSEIDKDLNKFFLKNGDMLIALTGATAGKIGIIKGSYKKYLLNQRVGKFEVKDGSFLNFIFYCLIHNIYREWLLDLAEGSAQGNMSPSDIKKYIVIPYPSPSEQSRIATVLSYFDDLIENKKRQNEILEKTAMAIFKSWFVDFEPFSAKGGSATGGKDEEFVESELGRIPKGWEVRELKEIINFFYGKGLPERERSEGKYPVVGSSGIIGYHTNYITEPPSIVIGRKGNAGSVQLILEPSFPIDTVFYSSNENTPEIIFYVYHYLKNMSLEDIGLTDTAVPGLNIHMLGSLRIFLPPRPILQKFHSLVEPLFQKIINNQKQIMILRKIRDTLLPLLVFGRLRVEEV